MTYVFDASPLIILARAERFDLVTHFEDCLLTERVHTEVVEAGQEHGYPDASRIARGIDEGVLAVRGVEADDQFRSFTAVDALSAADASTLALAAQADATVIMDENLGRDVASAHGIETRGTAFLVLSLVRDNKLSADEGRTVIDEMVDVGWYCSTDLYRKIERKLDVIEAETDEG